MRFLSIPAIYILELTASCNNRCMGCGNVYAHSSAQPMPAAQWKSLLAGFAHEAVRIALSGGEPTLHPEFDDIFDDVTSYNALVSVFTNGRWEEPQTFVKRLQGRPNLAGLLISLHGAAPQSHEAFTQIPGAFRETLGNIELTVRHGIPVTLSTIITHQNFDQIDKIAALARQIGVQCVTFPRYLGPFISGITPSLEELRIAIGQIEALMQSGEPVEYGICIPQCFTLNSSEGCTAGAVYVAVDPWGNVRPCNFSPSIIGSLHEHSMADLWHSDKMNAWRALMPAECTACAAYSVCHGGCRAVQELRSDKRDPLRGEPLTEYSPVQETKELPAAAHPRANFRVREEPFGYVILGRGQAMPVARAALEVLNACDGSLSFAQMAEQFGQPGLELLGELWELGLLVAE